MTSLSECAISMVEAGDISGPLFSMHDLDTDRAYPWQSFMAQPHVTDLLGAEVPGDAGFGGFKSRVMLLQVLPPCPVDFVLLR